MSEAKSGLALLREPFPANQISKLPKPKSKDAPKGHCDVCGGWHGLPAVHLDYVGHAALTDRLLDADPAWQWEPLAIADGLPVLDPMGGMWIKLTVCGVTRLGYGHAGDKQGGDAIKEIIGDALRNAAMRFGAALDLWHKGDLHGDDSSTTAPARTAGGKATTATTKAGPVYEVIHGVERGDAAGAATYLAGLAQKELDSIWAQLPEKIQTQLTAAWPATETA